MRIIRYLGPAQAKKNECFATCVWPLRHGYSGADYCVAPSFLGTMLRLGDFFE